MGRPHAFGDMLTTSVSTFLLVALAELGDKTMLLTLVLASRYRLGTVLAGVAAAILALQALAVIVGASVGMIVPVSMLSWIVGGLFVVFGAWMLLTAPAGDGEGEVRASARAGMLTAFASFFLAELGDKTQIMTAAIAADPAALSKPLAAVGLSSAVPSGIPAVAGVFVGSSLAMMAVNGIAGVLGSALGARLPRTVMARVAGAVFLATGAVSLWFAWRG